jgi:hypothetical protein
MTMRFGSRLHNMIHALTLVEMGKESRLRYRISCRSKKSVDKYTCIVYFKWVITEKNMPYIILLYWSTGSKFMYTGLQNHILIWPDSLFLAQVILDSVAFNGVNVAWNLKLQCRDSLYYLFIEGIASYIKQFYLKKLFS